MIVVHAFPLGSQYYNILGSQVILIRFMIDCCKGLIFYSFYTIVICTFNLDEVVGVTPRAKLTYFKFFPMFNNVSSMLVGNMTLLRVGFWRPI